MNSLQTYFKIGFSNEVKNLLKLQANKYGLPVTQYMKYIIFKHVEGKIEQIETVDRLTEEYIMQSEQNIKEGHYKIAKTEKEIEEHLNSL